jgi:adiponectin receptor
MTILEGEVDILQDINLKERLTQKDTSEAVGLLNNSSHSAKAGDSKDDQAKSESPFVGSRTQVDEHALDGNLCETGWRVNFNTCGSACKSMCMLHNETVNIWTHLVGAVVFFILMIYILITQDTLYDVIISDDSRVPKWPIVVFTLGGVIQMTGSWTFHLFYCMSEDAHVRCQRYDYAGIAVMCATSITPPFIYGFACKD